ncbi:Asp23/Gls24 family envelope stress response protein [Alkalihalobacterium bogoriense]|uniref:Asp23/Gls24 family envelope stress response protein n=1 Tax=Alkalihalobacterium bogoriense TaxID=246272 RepID=UPI000479BC28|nr:Asp23/Gls24 family envelope stress response protein [Alkalihalobacterium bogoriense]
MKVIAKILEDGHLYMSEQIVLDLCDHVIEEMKPKLQPLPLLKDQVKTWIRKDFKNGIEISFHDNQLHIIAKVSILYGECLPTLIQTFQSLVISELEEMTGFKVGLFDVKVEAVHFQS